MAVANLRLGFYGEGNTDDRFLPSIVERTVRNILGVRGRYEVDVSEPFIVPRKPVDNRSAGDERILQAARDTIGYDALIIHLDADAPDAKRTRTHRFEPAVRRVTETQENVCRRLVPIIPVRMSEAWMIADWETLVDLLNPTLKLEELRMTKDIALPRKPHESESNVDPKETLTQIIAFSQSHRRRASREVNMQNIQTQLGRSVRLDVLEKVPAYRQFAYDMTQALISIGMAK
jgi:hypothetical protein